MSSNVSRAKSVEYSLFYIPIQGSVNEYGKEPRQGFQWLRRVAMGLFLLEHVQLNNFLVWFATYCYIPLLGCILTVWINCTLHLFFSFVFPALREKYHWSMYSWRDVREIPLAHDALLALYVVLAHFGMLACITLIGYRLMCVVTDALIDSCTVVYDDVAGCSVGFYRLLHMYQVIFRLRYGQHVTFALVGIISLLLICTFGSDTFVDWNRENDDVFWMFCVLMVILMVGVHVHFRWTVKDSMGPEMVRWWRKAVPFSRRLYVLNLALYCCYHTWNKGYNYGAAGFCEGMLYLSIFHVVLIVANHITIFLHDLMFFVSVVVRDPTQLHVVSWCCVPILVLTMTSVAYFCFALITVHTLLLLLLLSTVVRRLCCESGRSSGKCTQENDTESPPQCPNMWKRCPGVLFRAFYRLMIFFTVALTLSLALWVSVKHPGLEGATPTQCEGDETGEHIRITARYITAYLYGLRDYEKPQKMLYEADDTKYNSARHNGLCSRLWPGGLHAADLSYFALMAYLQRNSSDFVAMLNFYKRYRDDAKDWVALPTNNTYGRAVFRHLYSPSKNLSVIAVRGTDITSPFDLLQNLLLFSETLVFKMFANLLPLSSLIPERVIIDYVAASSAISTFLLGGSTSDYYHLHVEDYLNSVKSKHIIITGHSLGGVVAHIVASRRSLPGVAFSSPGINLMRKKLRISPDAIDAFTTNVIVSNDVTVSVDTPGGVVYHIQCEHKTAEICHSIEVLTIRMWKVCPSYRAITRLNGTYLLNT